MVYVIVSFIPRPSYRPVFDPPTVCKNGGGRPGPFYHMNDVSVYQGRQREGRVPWLKELISHMHSLFWTRSGICVFASRTFETPVFGAKTTRYYIPSPAPLLQLDGGMAWERGYVIIINCSPGLYIW